MQLTIKFLEMLTFLLTAVTGVRVCLDAHERVADFLASPGLSVHHGDASISKLVCEMIIFTH